MVESIILQNPTLHPHPHPLDGIDQELHADWLEAVDHLDPLSCERDMLDELIQTAPTLASRAWLTGILEMRVRLAFITGMPFFPG